MPLKAAQHRCQHNLAHAQEMDSEHFNTKDMESKHKNIEDRHLGKMGTAI